MTRGATASGSTPADATASSSGAAGATASGNKAASATALGGDAASRRSWLSWAIPIGVCLLTGLYATVPVIFGSSDFYLTGDSDGQFLPTWVHLGEMLRSGNWPPLLDPQSWAGGNYPAEALFGVYNPVNALTWLFVSFFTNLAVAATLVKAGYLAMLALGAYLLSREYGAARWAAAVVAVALPFAGFTLYWEAACWAAGLIAFAYVPHVWWSLRKVAYSRLNPFWAFLIGALGITQGNPYGVLGITVVGLALVVEQVLVKNWRGLRRLVITGLCIAAWIPLVFLPLLGTVSVAHRGQLASIANNGFMRPELGDVLNLGIPTFLPSIETFRDPMSAPVVYFSWFLLPLLPWLRWSQLRGRLSALSGVLTFTVLYMAMSVGPSNFWFFRWPLRLVEYLYLGLAVALAVVLSFGFQRDRPGVRTLGSFALVLAGAYLAWAQNPATTLRQGLTTVVLAALTAALIWSIRRSYGGRRWTPTLVALAGTLAVIGLQVRAFPENESAGQWHFPHSLTQMRDRFAHRYTGTTLQLADLKLVRSSAMTRGPVAWRNFLGGSMYHAVGVQAVNTYSGIGFQAFLKRLCIDDNGKACPRAYRELWKPLHGGKTNLADLMKLQTIVVQRGLVPRVHAHPGWRVTERRPQFILLRRSRPLPWHGSRLSFVSGGVQVGNAATTSPTSETVQVKSAGTGSNSTLVFARLNWPGYTASINGRPASISHTAAGLLAVHLPPGVSSGTLDLSFTPPGQTLGLGIGGVATVVAAALGVTALRKRRNEPTPNGVDG